ncbi:holin [Corynebacterium callunae]|uniref:holin n=1 Tax=Corynebacterium callunae TaxID=1721 RepID=UPI001FFF9406|nr:holin [Corynebacterium callunae]MCK2200469.1 holin [Corynebacterium callunae]
MLASKTFFYDLAERAIKTAAQALLAVFVAGVTIMSVDWVDALAITGTAALVSILTSIASAGVGSRDSASLVTQVE